MSSKFREDLIAIFQQLHVLMEVHNQELKEQGSPLLKKQSIKIVGQIVLLLRPLPFSPTSTMDLDTVSTFDFWVQKTLESLLLEQGLHLESDGHLIWMPQSTYYEKILDLPLLELCLASAEDVIASKFRFKRKKDEQIIAQYLEAFPQQKESILKKVKEK